MTAVLTTRDLSKNFGGKAAVKKLSLSVDAGQVYGLLGLNGSGKTTTLGMLLGAVLPDSGSISWFGQGCSGRERRRIGALLEQPSFYPWLSGEANLKVMAAIKGLSPAEIARALDQVGLTSARKEPFQSYSLGMKQRLAIASALLGKPDVLVLDEPTNGVDAQGIYDIRSIISAFAAQGGTVILSSHMMDEVEKVCDHVGILKTGSLLLAGTTRSVLASGGWLELAASDLHGLAQKVRQLDPGARVEIVGEVVLVHATRLEPEELNRLAMSGGIALRHLVHRQPSLESQYLRLMGKEGEG